MKDGIVAERCRGSADRPRHVPRGEDGEQELSGRCSAREENQGPREERGLWEEERQDMPGRDERRQTEMCFWGGGCSQYAGLQDERKDVREKGLFRRDEETVKAVGQPAGCIWS